MLRTVVQIELLLWQVGKKGKLVDITNYMVVFHYIMLKAVQTPLNRSNSSD